MKQPFYAGRRLLPLAAVTALVIVYGSLFPFQFYRPIGLGNPVLALLHSWPARSGVGASPVDAIINVLVYAPLGAFAYLLCRQMGMAALSFAGPLLLALALSSSLEMAQLFVRGRVCSALDVVCNVTGAMLGVAAAVLFESKPARAMRSKAIRRGARPSAFFLALCWVFFQSFPFFPDISRGHLLAKLAAFRNSAAIAPMDVMTCAVGAIAFVEIVDQLVHRKLRNLAILSILALAPLRFLIRERTLAWSEAVGLALGCAAWLWLQRSRFRRAPVIAGLLSASVVLGGLMPFRFTAAGHPFAWIPFTGFLAGDWLWSFLVLFQKLFTYGALVWFLRESRFRLVPAALGVAALLAGIEAIQTHLPGRTSEISDPLLALFTALMFYLLDQTFRKDEMWAPLQPIAVSHRFQK